MELDFENELDDVGTMNSETTLEEHTVLPNKDFLAPYNHADRESWVPYYMCRISQNRQSLIRISSTEIVLPSASTSEKTYVFLCVSKSGGINVYHVPYYKVVERHVVKLSRSVEGAYMFSCKGLLPETVLPSCIEFDHVVTLIKFKSILSSFEYIQRPFLDKNKVLCQIQSVLKTTKE